MKILITTLLSFIFFNSMENALVSGYDIEDRAIDFRLKNVDGNMVSMNDFNDAKGFIISFTCNECPYATLYEERTIELGKEFAPKGFPVIAINPNDPSKSPGESFEKMVQRAKEKKYPFPYLVDESQKIAKTYGATNTPHIYVLQKEGEAFIVKYIGTIDNNPKSPEKATRHYVREAVNALLKGTTIEESKTKAIGCGIKWRDA